MRSETILFTAPRVTLPDAADPAARAARELTDTSRPGELSTGGGSGFGAHSSIYDRLAAASRAASAPFDVCHIGVVLRAVLVVQAAVAVGVAFTAASPLQWLDAYAGAAGIALVGTLCWLVAACALQRVLERTGEAAQTVVAAALGAASGALGWLPFALVASDAPAPLRALPPALAGAALGIAMATWLRLRKRSALPADTTARLAELQSRIRPHFLFNTLNTAMALVRVDPRRAEDMLADLAELFRVALAPGDAAVTLADEIDLAQRYLAIEQVRFGPRLAVQWELDADAARARVPPLLLQPLLENAVRHGIEPAPEGGTIRVRTRRRRSHTVLTIVNSVPRQPSVPGHGMALRNVRERLHLLHDVAAQFDARREGDWFKVQIVFPA